MHRNADCPDAPTLESILLGHGDTPEGVLAHLEVCPDCARRMPAVRAEDEVVAAMRDCPRVAASEEAAQALALIPVLKCLRPRDATGTWTSVGDETPFGGVTYSFLGPPAGEQELGSLGPYRILEVLGAGGMGVVFLARDDRLDRSLAVKVIRPGLSANPEAVRRFLAEARAAAAVEHDNIVPIYLADEQAGTPFLAMPLLRGESLEQRLQREQGPLPVAEVLRVGRETALGLAAAHDKGLIHRDIKPANLWLDAAAGGRVRILDFGLAAAPTPAAAGEPTGIAGTPAYMAPEQAAGRAVDGRADLFSLGCVLYRAATGHYPFRGVGAVGMLLSVAQDDPTPPRGLNPRVTRALESLILALLAKRPAGRPASAREVVARIDRMLAPGPSRRAWVLMAGSAGLAAGVGLWAWLGRTPTPAPPATPEPGPEVAPHPRPAFAGELRRHEMHSGPVTAVALAEHGGRLLAASAGLDRRVWLWDPTADEKPVPLRPAAKEAFFDAPLLALALTPDGTRAAVGGGDRASARGHRVEVWDVPGRKEIRLPTAAQEGLIQTVAFTADGRRFLEGRSNGLVVFWDLDKGDALGGYSDRDPKRRNLGIWALAVAKSGAFAVAGGGDGSAIVLGLKPVVHRKTHHDAHPGGVSAVAIFPDGRGFVTGGKDGVIRVWDLDAGSRPLTGHAKAVNGVAVSPTGARVVSAGEDGTLRAWDLAAGAETVVVSANAKGIKSVAVAADGRHVLTGGADGAVRFWKLPPE